MAVANKGEGDCKKMRQKSSFFLISHKNTKALFLFLWAIIPPDLDSLKILARFVFLKSCAVNKKRLFLHFLFSEWIPLQVRLEKLRQISQHHGCIITATTVLVFSWLLLQPQPQPPLLSPPPPPFLPLPQWFGCCVCRWPLLSPPPLF